jgi:hypothetical protein
MNKEELKEGTKLIAINEFVMISPFHKNTPALIIGKEYEIKTIGDLSKSITIDSEYQKDQSFYVDELNKYFKLKEDNKTPKHYDNSKGSLYLFAEQQNLNAWEFDALKRIIRSRKKGNFIEDIDKTIHVLELYKKEYKL